MNLKNLMAPAVLAASLSVCTAANAGTVTASNITWDETSLGGLSATVDFVQWYTNGDYGSGTVPKLTSSTQVRPLDANGLPTPGSVLSGVGKFTKFSDGRVANPSRGGSTFCTLGDDDCELTFTFGGLVPVSLTEFDFSNAWLNVYYDDRNGTPGTVDTYFGETDSSAQNQDRLDDAQDGLLWASFSFEEFIFTSLSGDFTDGQSYVRLSVVGGLPDVVEALDFGQGADLEYVTGVQFESNTPYSDVSVGNIVSVNAPSSLAVMGLSLLGFGFVARRRMK